MSISLRSAFLDNFHQHQRILATVLVLLSVANVLLLVRPTHESEHIYTYRGHDFPTNFIPTEDLPLVSMTFEETMHYPLLGIESDEQWLSLTPRSQGFGYVRLGPDHRLFAVAMFHQLHCLRTLNLGFWHSKYSTNGHLQHCLNYLRQVALCAADTTLEKGDFEQRNYTEIFDIRGETHTCRDWTVVYDGMRKNWDNWKIFQNTTKEFQRRRYDESDDVPDSPPLGDALLTSPSMPVSRQHDASGPPTSATNASFSPLTSQTWTLAAPLAQAALTMDSSAHYPFSGPSADALWGSLLPSNSKGILHFPSDPHTNYTISLFHSLRCLNIIRKELVDRSLTFSTYSSSSTNSHPDGYSNTSGIPILSPNGTQIGVWNEPEPSKLAHHCMNHIRQMLLCQADTRLQSCRRGSGSQISVPYVTHGTCRDWSAVYDAAEENWRDWQKWKA